MKISFTWPEYRAWVSVEISNAYGVGIDELADCDLEGRELFISDTDVVTMTKREWKELIRRDAASALENDDAFAMFFPGGAFPLTF